MEADTFYSAFGSTRRLPLVVMVNGEKVNSTDFEKTLWIERGEDWYAFMSTGFRDKKVRVIEREKWLQGEEIDSK